MSITKSLAKKLTNYDNRNSIGSRLRSRRITPFLQMVKAIFQQHGYVNVIDVGGMENYWHMVPPQYLEDHKVSITLVNLPGMPLPDDHGPFRFVNADGCDLSFFADNSFHIAHSNSVIEHVGDWARMTQFSKELQRVARKYFVQTPNYWFPLEPHFMSPFFHWLPKPFQVWLVMHLSLGHFDRASSVDEAVQTVEGTRLLNKSMFHELFPEAELRTERYLFMSKSFVAIGF